VSTLQGGIELIRLDQNNAGLRKLKLWLSQTDLAAQQSDILRRRHEGTGQWFLDTPEFSEWLHKSSSARTLLCTGIPGAGKTVMAAIAIDHLTTKVQNRSTGVAWLYCSYKSRSEQTAELLLSTILKQLIYDDKPTTVDLVEQLQRNHSDQGSRPTANDVNKTLEAVITEFTTVHIIIDALDECSADNGTRSQFLEYIRALQSNPKVRFMITSRHIPDIVEDFKDASNIEVSAHNQDVRLFLAGQISRLPKCVQRDAKLQEAVQDRIVGAIDGMYEILSFYIMILLSH
jgi:hypothetical protein